VQADRHIDASWMNAR
jgi:transposase